MITQKIDIRKLSLAEIENYFSSIGEKPYRAKQVYEWLWKKHAVSFSAMSNLGKELREKLENEFSLLPLSIHIVQKSSDGTQKFAFKLYDDKIVEGVLIPHKDRLTACVSSQVGCSLDCKFCATGYMKMQRNLEAAEIFDEVFLINEEAIKNYGKRLTNIVYMGMGEPLLNYKNVLSSAEKISSADGLEFSPRRITVSTVGIARQIKKMGDDKVKFEVALSLHSANDKKRSEIMPINETNNIESLTEAFRYFYEKTGTRISIEYILFRDFNDGLQDAKELAAFCRKIPSKVNIIEYNPIPEAKFQFTTPDRLARFLKFLEQNRLIVNVRRSRGRDIAAACGQLAIRKT